MRKLIFIAALFLTSCGLAEEKNIVGRYYLEATDIREQMALGFQNDLRDPHAYGFVVSPCVFAVGYNDRYIIVKQHPDRNMFIHLTDTSKSITIRSSTPNKKITNYYIVPIQDSINWRTLDSIIVPLTKSQFDQKRKELGIEDIQFTIVYKDLE